jgi:hypothetical protein
LADEVGEDIMHRMDCVTYADVVIKKAYQVRTLKELSKTPPMKEEIRCARVKSSLTKAPGPDAVAAELLKFRGEMTLTKLHEICVEVWDTGKWPKEWTQSIFILRKYIYIGLFSTVSLISTSRSRRKIGATFARLQSSCRT